MNTSPRSMTGTHSLSIAIAFGLALISGAIYFRPMPSQLNVPLNTPEMPPQIVVGIPLGDGKVVVAGFALDFANQPGNYRQQLFVVKENGVASPVLTENLKKLYIGN
jgi:hypothetical protein